MAAPPRAGTLRDWVGYAERRFSGAKLHFGHGTSNARDEAVWLLVHVLGIDHEQVNAAAGRTLDARQSRKVPRLIELRIASRKPLAYLLHEAWLAGERFYVDERVIVPRSFIAELIPDALEPWLPRRGPKRILDLCTGSGCLAILAAKAFPGSKVDASDVSPAALAVARRNVSDHRLRTRVRLFRSDLFTALPPRRYDLIVSNPPYVRESSMRRLPPEYRHEPGLALGAGAEGLDLVLRILERAPGFLSPRGVLVVEIGHNRPALERRTRGLDLTWMGTSAGDDMVFVATRGQLTGRTARG